MNPFDLQAGPGFRPWQLWTCHLLHYGVAHALANLAALAAPLILLPAPDRKRLALALLALGPLLALALLPWLGDAGYRGASGLACAAWAVAGTRLAAGRRWEGWALLALLALKLGAECLAGLAPLRGGPGWVPLPAAHLTGTALGLVAAPWLGLRTKG